MPLELKQDFVHLVFGDDATRYKAIERAIRDARRDEFVIVGIAINASSDNTLADSYLEAFSNNVIVSKSLFERAQGRYWQTSESFLSLEQVKQRLAGDDVSQGWKKSSNYRSVNYVFQGGDAASDKFEEFEREYERLYDSDANLEQTESHVDGWVVAKKDKIRSGNLVVLSDIGGDTSVSGFVHALSVCRDILSFRNPSPSKTLYSVYESGDEDVVAYVDDRAARKKSVQCRRRRRWSESAGPETRICKCVGASAEEFDIERS